MLKDPKFRREVYVGVIVAVLVMLVIEPLLRFAANSVIWAGTNLYDGLTNSIYRSAALGFREKFSFITLAFSLSFFLGIFAAITTAALFRKDRPPLTEERLKRKKRIAIVLSVTLFLEVYYLVGTNFADLQLNASFSHRLTVLAPKISDQQLKIFRARWATMEKRSDYVALNSEMETIAERNGVKLPEPLWE